MFIGKEEPAAQDTVCYFILQQQGAQEMELAFNWNDLNTFDWLTDAPLTFNCRGTHKNAPTICSLRPSLIALNYNMISSTAAAPETQVMEAIGKLSD